MLVDVGAFIERSGIARRENRQRRVQAGRYAPPAHIPYKNMKKETHMTSTVQVDLGALKRRQQAAWSSGDYGIVGTTLDVVGEQLCEAVDLRSPERVLDVACGNGNAALAAARRFSDVSAIDYVPALLEQGRDRARGDRLPVAFQLGDAEAIPFPDSTFDVVLSTFGVMFSANQQQAAAELARVCRSGGRIGMANWTPDGFIGQLFRILARYNPPAPGVQSPMRWGSAEGLHALFGDAAQDIQLATRTFVFRYQSAQHWLEVFRSYYGPTVKAFETLDAARRDALARDILALLHQYHQGGPGLAVPSDYLEVVITRR
jgi:ubiquinone/menaquinone biosynthesis C-methylase UbiE